MNTGVRFVYCKAFGQAKNRKVAEICSKQNTKINILNSDNKLKKLLKHVLMPYRCVTPLPHMDIAYTQATALTLAQCWNLITEEGDVVSHSCVCPEGGGGGGGGMKSGGGSCGQPLTWLLELPAGQLKRCSILGRQFPFGHCFFLQCPPSLLNSSSILVCIKPF